MPNEFRVKRGLIVETTGSLSGSSVVTVDGVAGRLFTVVDTFSGSLFSVNTVAGLPVIEAFSDNTVRIGQHGQRALFVSQSRVGIGKETGLNANLDISGSVIISGSFRIISGAIDIAAYTSSGHLLLPDINEGAGTFYDFPQVRLRGSRTGITLGNVDETYFVNNQTPILGLKSESGDGRVMLPSTGWLIWNSGTAINSWASKDIILKRSASAVLDITGSLKISGSINHHRSLNRQTSNYTLVLGDAGRLIEMNSGSVNTVTVPASSSVNFPSGTFVDVVQYGAGQTSFVTGSGVTIRSANNHLKINAQYGAATLTKIGANEWYLFGNLNA